MSEIISRGDIWLIAFDPTIGDEITAAIALCIGYNPEDENPAI
jgi:hypothetical protein